VHKRLEVNAYIVKVKLPYVHSIHRCLLSIPQVRIGSGGEVALEIGVAAYTYIYIYIIYIYIYTDHVLLRLSLRCTSGAAARLPYACACVPVIFEKPFSSKTEF